MKTHYSVIIIGGGQAGLSMSYILKERGIDHVVFEKSKVAESWRSQRWDTFCLVTPNWQCKLPGYSYSGEDPQGFMVKDQIVDFLETYVDTFNPPLIEGLEVKQITRPNSNDVYILETNQGTFTADQVVVATGNFHFASFPKMSAEFPADVTQIHSSQYKNPQSLPEGEILVVGTGQSGCQIAEDLHLAGKKVHLCVGAAPRTARRYRGKDVVEWLDYMGYYDLPVDEHPEGEAVRQKTNHYVTGRDGGREIDLRNFALEGMKLYGPLTKVEGDALHFLPELKLNLDNADQSSENIKKKIDAYIRENNIDAVTEPTYVPAWEPVEEITSIDYKKSSIGVVVWCIGYGYDFSWVKQPVFDASGLPIHKRGVTSSEGLYFLGLTWQNTWGSARFSGVANDALYLADRICAVKKEMEKCA